MKNEIMKPIDGIEPLQMADHITVGFGSAFVTKNNECFYYAPHDAEYESCLSVEALEAVAKNFPDDDWRVHLCGPLSELHYQRQSDGRWICYERGDGFA